MKPAVIKFLSAFIVLHCLFLNSAFAEEKRPLEKMEELGRQFAQAINNQQSEKVEALLDLSAMSDRILNLAELKIPFKEQSSLKKGIKEGIKRNYVLALMRSVEDGATISFRRIIKVGTQNRALILFDFGENGMAFYELLFDEKVNSIIDWYDYASGSLLSKSYATALSFLIPESNFLQRLVGNFNVDRKLLDTFKKIGAFNRAGNSKAAYQELKKLPREIYNHEQIFAMRVVLSQSISDKEYQKQLYLLDKFHGHRPELFLLLLDHYFYEEKYDRAIDGILRLNRRFNNEPKLLLLMSTIYYLKKELEPAVIYAEKSVKHGIDEQEYYWNLSELYIEAERYKEVVELFKKMEPRFQLEFDYDFFRNEEAYKKFSRSRAFKEWAGES
ncbi:tetratricopeptide repeat protein [Pleionea sediminis]|uniref:tetratricopeptide repeat protein n=1 Tax=Pleionea sediminis TaxID=2569479 RepID=UPI0011869A63|nr:hypothetical protein [Pleionea sediminis]